MGNEDYLNQGYLDFYEVKKIFDFYKSTFNMVYNIGEEHTEEFEKVYSYLLTEIDNKVRNKINVDNLKYVSDLKPQEKVTELPEDALIAKLTSTRIYFKHFSYMDNIYIKIGDLIDIIKNNFRP